MAYITRNGAVGYPSTGETIHVYDAGTTDHVTGLTDLSGNPIDNTAGFAVPADDFWGFEPATRAKLDVYWTEGARYLVQNAILKDPYLPSDVSALPLATATTNHTPSGFPDHNGCTLSLAENYGAVNDTFRVTITGTNFPVYIDGVLHTKNTESITQVGATTRRYYIYYAADGTLSISTSEWALDPGDYAGEAPICTVYWDATNHRGRLEEERHHSWRDIHWHHWAHHSIGPRYSGFHTGNGLNLTNPDANQYATFLLSAGELYDEDIPNNIDAHTTMDMFYHHSDGTMIFERGVTVPYKLSGGIPQYDTGTGLAGKNASNTQGYFVSWIYATNAYRDGAYTQAAQFAVVIGQDTDGSMSLTEAQNAALPSLPTTFVSEWKLIWKMIFRYGAGAVLTHISNTDYRTASSLPAGQAPIANVNANAITFAPAGNIAATNVQAAIEELDTEKQATSAGLTDLIAKWTPASASGASSLKFAEDTDNGTNTCTLQGPASTADVTVTLPATTGTVALTSEPTFLLQRRIFFGGI